MKDKVKYLKIKEINIWQKWPLLDQQISSTEDDLKYVKEQLDIQLN